jgi:hypothetical protein
MNQVSNGIHQELAAPGAREMLQGYSQVSEIRVDFALDS